MLERPCRHHRGTPPRLSLVLAAVLGVLPATPAAAQTVADVFPSVSDAVVVVQTSQTEYPTGSPVAPVSVGGLGSGVLIAPTQVFTAAHVVQAADEVEVVFPSGERIGARVVSSRTMQDVALLELARAPRGVTPAPLGDSDSVVVGEQVFVVGAPFGVSHTLTVGHVSARRTAPGMFGGVGSIELLQTDAAINQGNSGGPMFNLRGEVVGIVSYIITQSGGFQGLGFAVTSNLARGVLLEEPSFWTGIESLPTAGLLGELLNVPPATGGVLVQRVAQGSVADVLDVRPGTIPATIAGEEILLGGDIIIAVQGIPLGPEFENVGRIRDAVAIVPPGLPVQMTVLRDGKRLELSGPNPRR
jgi:S1-C subfamily serine protease